MVFIGARTSVRSGGVGGGRGGWVGGRCCGLKSAPRRAFGLRAHWCFFSRHDIENGRQTGSRGIRDFWGACLSVWMAVLDFLGGPGIVFLVLRGFQGGCQNGFLVTQGFLGDLPKGFSVALGL